MTLHTARTFAKPDPSLLTEIAEGVCEFGPIKPDRPIVLYGWGDMGKMALEYLRFVGIEPSFTTDDMAAIGLERIPKDFLALVSIANYPYVPIERSLADLGFQHIAPFYDICESYRDVHPLSNGWFAEPFSAEDLENISAVYERWSDDTSRAHYLSFLAWRRLREEWSFDDVPVTTDDRYFIPEVVSVLHDHETFVDGGAYDGRVSNQFWDLMGGAFERIIAFEPDGMSEKLFMAKTPRNSVTFRNCALSDEHGRAGFRSGFGYASQLSADGPGPGITRTLDSLGYDPTFIKLHLEGHELAALRGAQATLERCRPILAITAYHNADGLWRLPLHLMDSLSDYRWLWRNHAFVGTGAVIYGIPEERGKST